MATREIAPAQVIVEVEHGFGLSAAELARALGVSAETLRCWRTGKSALPSEAWACLQA